MMQLKIGVEIQIKFFSNKKNKNKKYIEKKNI